MISEFFELSESNHTLTDHSFKLYVKSLKCNSYKCSFFVRIIQEWNKLPQQVVEAGTFKLIKARLKRLKCK